MKPADLDKITEYSSPILAPDGTVVYVVSRPNLERNAYDRRLFRLRPGGQPEPLSNGPEDFDPVLAPDGRTVYFRRALDGKPPQLYTLPLDGGEARRLTDHPLGAGRAEPAPDGRHIAYLAAVPEPGRYGTDPGVNADAEPPRPISRLSYRLDNEGFVLDRRAQVHLLDVGAGAAGGEAAPVVVTAEPGGARQPVFTPDGAALLYLREAGVDVLQDEIARLDLPGPLISATPSVGRKVLEVGGRADGLVVSGDTVFYLAASAPGIDFAGRTTGLWSVSLMGGDPVRLTDEQSVDLATDTGRPVLAGDAVLCVVLERGAQHLVAVPGNAAAAPLDELERVIDGDVVVKAAAARDGEVVAVLISPEHPGVLQRVRDDGNGRWSATVLATGTTELPRACRQAEVTGQASDGYPVHGFLVLPDGPGPHPLIVNVHGGPHYAHTRVWFDEAQVYAGAGYAVLQPNPRGSAGYGQEHGRALLGRMGEVDVDDVLSLLDAALQRDDLDAGHVGLMGGSYGGFFSSWVAGGATGRFTAHIVERAVTAWDSFTGSSDIGWFFTAAYVGADRQTQWDRSPLSRADRIDRPVLILHSEQDWRCPVEQAQRLFVGVRQAGGQAELLLFPGEGHELTRSGKPRHRQQRFDAVLAWWSRHLAYQSDTTHS